MAADAVQLAWSRPDLDVYVLVTGEGDFVPVVHALRRRGKTVVGVFPHGGASRSLAAMCDRFVRYGVGKDGPRGILRGLARRVVRRALGYRHGKLASLCYEAMVPRRRSKVTKVFEAARNLDGEGPFTVRDIQDRLDGTAILSRRDVVRFARLAHGGRRVAVGGASATRSPAY